MPWGLWVARSLLSHPVSPHATGCCGLRGGEAAPHTASGSHCRAIRAVTSRLISQKTRSKEGYTWSLEPASVSLWEGCVTSAKRFYLYPDLLTDKFILLYNFDKSSKRITSPSVLLNVGGFQKPSSSAVFLR